MNFVNLFYSYKKKISQQEESYRLMKLKIFYFHVEEGKLFIEEILLK